MREETATEKDDETILSFGPFRVEASKRLWHGSQEVKIRSRPLALLRYLVERPQHLVTKEELLKRLWPGIYVTKTVLKVCVREIRQALADDATTPKFIETVGTQGYRFIAPLTTTPPILSPQFSVSSAESGISLPQLTTDNGKFVTPFVGRDHELALLHAAFTRAKRGERQIVLISGEAGIGKTTLVERFLMQVQARGTVKLGHGHCVEQHERGEAYLPVLQAVQQLCRAPDGDQVVAVLRRTAPLWLVQLSGVIDASELEMLQRQVQGSSPQRMLREFGEMIERVAAQTPLILSLEDLHWSDVATLELLAYLAQRRGPARLLVIGTYRPADTVASGHPLRRIAQGLVGRGQGHELALELLTEAEVEAYVSQRLGGSPLGAPLSPVIYHRTNGNALFVMHFVDYLIDRNLLVEIDGQWELRAETATVAELIPHHVEQLLVRQIEGLSREAQLLLEIASVVGLTFTAREVAGVVNHSLEAVEAAYDELANQGQLTEVPGLAEWPDGSITVRYGFRHALYRQVLYHRIGLVQRVRWHRQLGEHFATIYGERTQEIASELALHFEQGRDYRRAIFYRQQAGEQALQQSAHQKALGHGQAGLALLPQLPPTAERGQLELRLRQLVNSGLVVTRGFADDELEESLQRAQQLCRELEDEAALVSEVIGLARLQLFRANRPALEDLTQQEERLTERLNDPLLLVQLRTHLVSIELARGRHTHAEAHYQHVARHCNSHAHRSSHSYFAADPFVVALTSSGLSLSLAGWLEQGWSRIAQGLARAEEGGQYVLLANGLWLAVVVKSLRGECEAAGQLAQKMGVLTREYGFSLYAALGGLLQGSVAVQGGALQEGIAAIISGLAQYRVLGAQLFVPYFLSFLADGYRHQGKVAEALQVVNDALSLTVTNFDVFWEAELYRIKGELTLQKGARGWGLGVGDRANQGAGSKKQKLKIPNTQHLSSNTQTEAETEACFHQAIEIARRQGAKLLELRAAMSLSRLWQQQGKEAEARRLLSDIYTWFTEGFDTKDLQEARALRAELA